MKHYIYFLLLFISFSTFAQNKIYRAERSKIHNLEHTKLKVDFNFETSQMNGEAWVTVSPHFYDATKLVLDAKAFTIHEVSIEGVQKDYNYTNDQLTIELGKTYTKSDSYTVYIKYTANPEEVRQKGSTAISDAKGLYFIDPKDEDPEKPTQIWTQGETESSSCWFPTIDAPNQKTSQEIYMTVPSKFVTLSNGDLISSTDNTDGSRTDYWKMDEKHAPYLFFMGVGEFSVVEDTWNGKKVDYYVEPEYEDVARDIFGMTPEMMTFFSDLLDYPYPWDKYSQIVVRDYVSGAMENTTAVVHGEEAQQKKGALLDENIWEGTIAHELLHHWFGDLVTTESWANLTVNESFATYSVYLWYEHKYGKDKAAAHMYNDVQTYLNSQSDFKHLVRFDYQHREDMFDTVSYHKGSAILHMLRGIIGDQAFFEGMRVYLKKYEFGTAEAHQLRLAFEEVTGRDLNWFFNQWYYGSGHIKMNVTYDYNTINNTVTVNIRQQGDTFKFPITIDVYERDGKNSYVEWVSHSQESFTYKFSRIPDLIVVDAKHELLAVISEKKTLDNLIYQFNNAPHYLDRRLALEEIIKFQQESRAAYNTVIKAFNDPYYEIREIALNGIDLFQKYTKGAAIAKIESLANNDPHTKVRAAAITVLGKLIDPKYLPAFRSGVEEESYAVVGASLVSMYQLDKPGAVEVINSFDKSLKQGLADAVTRIYIAEKDDSQLPFIADNVLNGMFLTQDTNTQALYAEAFKWIAESDNEKAIRNVTEQFVKLGKQYKQFGFDKMAVNLMSQMVQLQAQSMHANKNELSLIIKTAMAELIE